MHTTTSGAPPEQGTANQFISGYAGRLEHIWLVMVAKEELTIYTHEGVNSNVKLMLMDKCMTIRVGSASFSKTSDEPQRTANGGQP